ncbi:hypothetical protein [Bosea sp. BK604]|uniref:hypothetical protein n=1 Tax=Bosea sp. BK604 TaxID=2512180 RepID=UPI00104B8F5D|nr:hypothetical protein [Bosea sp. BK604]TCR65683.1 hypothetical protein EV560_105446 [Bosea sp. BK604]
MPLISWKAHAIFRNIHDVHDRASRDEESAVSAAIALAFATDPMARWSLRNAKTYLAAMPDLICAFGAPPHDSDSADVSEDFGRAHRELAGSR